MQSGQNPFSKVTDATVPAPLAPAPAPPTYQQHFQTVRFATATLNPVGQQFGHHANNNKIFGSATATPTAPTSGIGLSLPSATTSMPIFGSSAMAAATTTSIFGGFAKAPDTATTAFASPSTPKPAFCLFPAGASPSTAPSKFRFVASRLGQPSASATASATASTSASALSSASAPMTSSSNVFEKRFGVGNVAGGTGPIANVFGKVDPRIRETAINPKLQESKAGGRDDVPANKPLVRRSGLDAVVESSRSSFKSQRALAGSGTDVGIGITARSPRRSRLPSKDIGHLHQSAEPRTRRLSERSRSEDVAAQRTAIVLKGVPARLNNKRFLLERFGRYGIVQRINCMVQKEMSVINYTDHESARKAKENGAELEPGTNPVLILLNRTPTSTSRSSRNPLALATRDASSGARSRPDLKGRRSSRQSLKQSPKQSELQVPSRNRNDDPVDVDVDIDVAEDDVRAELKTMSEGGSLVASTVLQRPRDAASAPDTPPPPPPSTHLLPKHGSPAKSTRRSSPHPHPHPVPAPSSSHMPQLTTDGCDSIQALSHRQALNTADKFQVLVARDKFIRQGLKKPADLASAQVAVGTCPDMCPEKERYMREERGQLHPYEVLAGIGSGQGSAEDQPRVDHRRAIKEYSRSSADQEEPLPHELRPPDVLQRTMDYLVCNVMDLLDDGGGDDAKSLSTAAAEWYDFVWNRTRGIRKDITQQHLCDQTSVALAEKCTRFHIHCAERLCEEDMSVFDQKINNENLTKCLQTLKHLYADLALKGERCAHEAEFRAYDILLNLNEGDTLREVLCLPADVRRSSDVRFALRLFADVNSNNYVSFFRHVRAAPYLVACILQRYFTQVRERALKVILKAYCAPNHAGQFPVGKFVEMLAFEDAAEARDFLGYHSLSVEYDYVVWDRAAGLSYPESAVPTRRARLLIESKRHCSVGEVVNGGKLPENPLDTYAPHSSFDVHGKLNDFGGLPTTVEITSTDIDSRQLVVATAKTMESTVAVTATATRHPMTVTTDDEQRRQLLRQSFTKAVEEAAADIADEATTTMIDEACQASLDEVQVNLAVMTVASGLLTEVTRPIIRDVADAVLREFKIAELKFRRMREEAELERQRRLLQIILADIVDDVLDEVVDQETSDTVSAILRKRLQKQWQRDCDQCSEQLAIEYEDRWTSQFTLDVASQVHREEAEYRRSTLARVSRNIDGWRALTFCNKWRRLVARRKRTRQSMTSFPSSACLRHDSLVRWTERPLKPTQLQSPVQIANDQTYNKCLLDIGVYRRHIENRLKETRLDLQAIAKNCSVDATDKVGGRSYWKVAVCTSEEEGDESEFSEWVQVKLHCKTTNVSCLSEPTSAGAKAFCGRFDDPDACMQLCNSRELQGSRGMVMVLSSGGSFLKPYWEEEYRRLLTMLNCMSRRPAIPVLVLCPWLTPLSNESGDIVKNELHLNSLVRDGRIKAYRIATDVAEMKEPAASVNLIGHMEWLAFQCPQAPDLRSVPLEVFVDDCVSKFFSSVLCCVTRHGTANLHPPPDLLVSRYNDVIRFAAELASSHTLKDVSWPPLEMSKEHNGPHSNLLSVDWNCDDNLARLRRLVERYSLPPLSQDIVESITFEQLLLKIQIYVDASFPALETLKSKGSKTTLTTRIQQIVNHASRCYSSDKSRLRPADVVQWIDLMQAVVDHVFSCIVDVDVTVVYDCELAKLFPGHKEWDTAVDRAMEAAASRLKASTPTSDAKVDSHRHEDPRRVGLHGTKRKLHQDPFAEPSLQDQLHSECVALSQQLAAERRKNAEYESYLKSLLAGTGKLMNPLNKLA